MTAQLLVERLAIDVDGIPGIDPHIFQQALTRELRRVKLPTNLNSQSISHLQLPALKARLGESENALAARAAHGLFEALNEAARS